jgi:hypothetical protein
VDKTLDCFEQTLQEIYHKYVGAEASRDIQFKYFRTLHKPIKLIPLNHSSQMLMLAQYGNKLPDNEPPLMDEQIKKVIFQSFLAQ